MVDSISSLNVGKVQLPTPGAAAPAGTEATEGGSFKDVLLKNLNEVNKLQQDADSTLENYVTGKTSNVGEVISASQKATLAFSMLVQIRNKLQDAYDEIKNLRV